MGPGPVLEMSAQTTFDEISKKYENKGLNTDNWALKEPINMPHVLTTYKVLSQYQSHPPSPTSNDH